jgi:hypothetical protein
MSELINSGNVIPLPLVNFPVGLSWSKYKDGLKIPTIRNSDLSLHKPFQSFILSVAANTSKIPRAFKSTIEPIAYALLEYATFLTSIRRNWLDANDQLLVDYREYSYENVKNSEISRGEMEAKQTTNIKLRILYEFYTWATDGIELETPHIEWNKDATIRSTLPLHSTTPNKWNSRPKNLYPQCFQDAGEGSSNMSGQHWATNAELNDIEDYFRDNHQPATAERNVLFLRTVDQTGLRLGSVNSLVIDQFSETSIEKSYKAELLAHVVKPRTQKFSRRNFFDFPYALALEINRYIKSVYGADIFLRAKHDESLAKLPLFTSMNSKKSGVSKTKCKTLCSLSNGTWTDIFTKAFQAISCPIGSGIHSVRRKFAEDWFNKEIQRYIDQGLPISYTDIVAGLAKVLGHDSELSQEAYRRASSMSRVNTPLDILTEQNRELTIRVMQLTAQAQRKDDEIEQLNLRLSNAECSVKIIKRRREQSTTRALS